LIAKIKPGKPSTALPYRRNTIPNAASIIRPKTEPASTCAAACQFTCKAECPVRCCRVRTFYSTENNPRSFVPTRQHTTGRKPYKCPDACRTKCRTFCPWQCCLIPYRRSYMKP
jgi:hypothetical protein